MSVERKTLVTISIEDYEVLLAEVSELMTIDTEYSNKLLKVLSSIVEQYEETNFLIDNDDTLKLIHRIKELEELLASETAWANEYHQKWQEAIRVQKEEEKGK